MTMPTLDELVEQCLRVRSEPQLPFQASRNRSRAELLALMLRVRAELTSAIAAAPDAAFEAQAPTDDGEPVRSVGEIVGHTNATVVNLAARIAEATGVAAPEFPPDLHATREAQVRDRAACLAAAGAPEFERYYAALPDDALLDQTQEVGFFGTMSGRAWLYFMAMHEAEHVAQIRALSEVVQSQSLKHAPAAS